MYKSTRDGSLAVPSAETIVRGISPEGGLFVPEEIPRFGPGELEALRELPYTGRAVAVLRKYLTDFTGDELSAAVEGAYTGTFEGGRPAPLRSIGTGRYILELWHGPTCAFKDLALQLLPRLMPVASRKTGGEADIVILVATSGDTGKAALEGFRDVEHTRIMVFYPENGVSEAQKLQMRTQRGGNVYVCGIRGNFDDAQTAVKNIFTDKDTAAALSRRGMRFSSANSINWGRLVPQIAYYVSAYCDLLDAGEDLSSGFNVAVPTGNFGNILAAYYAKRMGVPINRLICASNENRVLTDFLTTGVYDRRREFRATLSPSMDILISSNLERMLYELCDRDDGYVTARQTELRDTGRFAVEGTVRERFSGLFYAGSCDDSETLATIAETYRERGVLCDTHTAVAMNVSEKYLAETGDQRPLVTVSTANPYKFSPAVLRALTGGDVPDSFAAAEKLNALTGAPVPRALSELRSLPVRFSDVCRRDEIAATVTAHL